MKERIVTVLDGPLDGRRMAVRSPSFSGVEAPALTGALQYADADAVVRFQETVYDVVELRRDLFVAVPRSWKDDERAFPNLNLFDRICRRLAERYVGEQR